MRIGKSSGHLLVENQKVKKKNIASLKSDTGLSLMSARGKLERGAAKALSAFE